MGNHLEGIGNAAGAPDSEKEWNKKKVTPGFRKLETISKLSRENYLVCVLKKKFPNLSKTHLFT